MTTLREAPHGQVDDLIHKLAAAGLTTEHIKALLADQDKIKAWVDALRGLDLVQTPSRGASSTSGRISLKDAFSNGSLDARILTVFTFHMRLYWLDDITVMCEDEMSHIRGVGPVMMDHIKAVLDLHDLRLSVHYSGTECATIKLPSGGVVMRGDFDNLSVGSITSVTLKRAGERVPTVGQFRAMSNEERERLFEEWTIQHIFSVIDFYTL